MYHEIIVNETGDGIGIVTLNRPEKRNALTIRMRREISHCLTEWSEAPHIGAVIFTGLGSAFTAGFDLTEFTKEELFGDIVESSSRYHRDIWYFPKPTIAAVNGPAMGGGMDLALFCDIRICSETAVFGHPEIKLGAPPVFSPLKWMVGEGVARNLCLTGRKVEAEEALRLGLVSEVVPADGVLARAIEIAKEILKAPENALRFTKQYFANSAGKGFEETFSIEHDQAFTDVLFPNSLKNAHRSLP